MYNCVDTVMAQVLAHFAAYPKVWVRIAVLLVSDDPMSLENRPSSLFRGKNVKKKTLSLIH